MAEQTAAAFRGQVSQMMFACAMITGMVRQYVQMPVVSATFHPMVTDIHAQIPAMRSMTLMPAGVVRMEAPTTPTPDFTIGRDMLQGATRDLYTAAVTEERVFMFGPLALPGGGSGLQVGMPIFTPGVPADATFGQQDDVMKSCGSICYNATTRTKFWGFIIISATLGDVDGARSWFTALEEQGYRYALQARHAQRSEADRLLDAQFAFFSREAPRDPITVQLALPQGEWMLAVSPQDSWQAGWVAPVLVCVVVASVAISGLLFGVLFFRRRHDLLLETLLPKEMLDSLVGKQQPVQKRPAMTTDSPADLMLSLTSCLLEGETPDLSDVMIVRTAIRENYDLYQPLNLAKQIKGANMDADVTRALMRQLGQLETGPGGRARRRSSAADYTTEASGTSAAAALALQRSELSDDVFLPAAADAAGADGLAEGGSLRDALALIMTPGMVALPLPPPPPSAAASGAVWSGFVAGMMPLPAGAPAAGGRPPPPGSKGPRRHSGMSPRQAADLDSPTASASAGGPGASMASTQRSMAVAAGGGATAGGQAAAPSTASISLAKDSSVGLLSDAVAAAAAASATVGGSGPQASRGDHSPLAAVRCDSRRQRQQGQSRQQGQEARGSRDDWCFNTTPPGRYSFEAAATAALRQSRTQPQLELLLPPRAATVVGTCSGGDGAAPGAEVGHSEPLAMLDLAASAAAAAVTSACGAGGSHQQPSLGFMSRLGSMLGAHPKRRSHDRQRSRDLSTHCGTASQTVAAAVQPLNSGGGGSGSAGWTALLGGRRHMRQCRQTDDGMMVIDAGGIGMGDPGSCSMSRRGSGAVYRSACYVPPIPPPPAILDEAERALAACDGWEFDGFKLQEATQGHALSTLGFFLVHRAGLMTTLKLDAALLARYLVHIEGGYLANPYHNAVHAASVLQALHVLLHQGRLAEHYVDPLGLLAAYMAAAVHDYGHYGLTNDFLVATSDGLALRYNDRSPMENHHCAAAFEALQRPELNFMKRTPRQQQTALRKQVIEMVLATDMKQHFAILSHFNAAHRLAPFKPGATATGGNGASSGTGNAPAAAGGGPGASASVGRTSPRMQPSNAEEASPGAAAAASPGPPRVSSNGGVETRWSPASGTAGAVVLPRAPSPQDETERLLGLQVALKCADLGHLAAAREVHERWLGLLEEEFFLQGDRERAAGMAISPLFDRRKQGASKSQVGFYDFVVLPLFHAFAGAFPGAHPLLQCALGNYRHWVDVAAAAAAAAPAPAPASGTTGS